MSPQQGLRYHLITMGVSELLLLEFPNFGQWMHFTCWGSVDPLLKLCEINSKPKASISMKSLQHYWNEVCN